MLSLTSNTGASAPFIFGPADPLSKVESTTLREPLRLGPGN